MVNVNPKILYWARKTSGLEIEEAVKKLSLSKLSYATSADRLKALESGEEVPTRQLLVKMAKKYRRPLLIFYLAQPPKRGDRGTDFRKLPIDYSEINDALMDALLRDINVRQSLLKSVLEDEEEFKPLKFVGSISLNTKPKDATDSIRKILDINIEDFRAQDSAEEAFNFLRAKAETAGIFVLLIKNLGSYHTNIGLNIFRGYALADEIAPFVIINKNDSYGAWSFTLIHELAHIWLGETGISGGQSDMKIEKFCNEIAGNFLLPEGELSEIIIDSSMKFDLLADLISRFSHDRNVSSTMVTYKLYRAGQLGFELWQKLSKFYHEKWIEGRNKLRKKGRERNGGPNYYVVHRHSIGTTLINLVRGCMNEGLLTTSKAGKVLGVKAKKVQNLFDISSSEFTNN